MAAMDNVNPLQFNSGNSTEKYGEIHAYSAGGEHVGQLRWALQKSKLSPRPGEVVEMYVDQDARGHGVATQMWQHGKDNFPQGPEHSPARTVLGDKFARSTGDPVPAWKKKLPPVD